MLKVWTVCVGDKYTDKDVQIVRRMVERNLSQPHEFRCLADRPIADIQTEIPDNIWPGWWSKLLLFKHSTGPSLYLDLDVVITGRLDQILSERLSMPANWAQSGHGGCQSSVMSWSGEYPDLWENFQPERLETPKDGDCGRYAGLWGDQEYITQVMGCPGKYIKYMQGIYSYKYHCRSGLPDDARVVCFHGKPKPSEVSDPWVVTRRFT